MIRIIKIFRQKIGQEIGFIKRGTIYIDDKIDNKHMGFELNLK